MFWLACQQEIKRNIPLVKQTYWQFGGLFDRIDDEGTVGAYDMPDGC